MNLKNFNLTLLSIFLIALFFNMPIYHKWLWENLFNPRLPISEELQHMSLRKRMELRHGQAYVAFEKVASILDKNNAHDAILLVPPNKLLKERKVEGFSTVEPSEFYYFTGYKSAFATSPDAKRANWAIFIINHKAILNRISNDQQRDSLLNIYGKYVY